MKESIAFMYASYDSVGPSFNKNHGNPKASFGSRFRSKLRGIKYLLMRYNSTNKLPFVTLMKFESHYPPLRGIIRLANLTKLRL